MASGPNKAATAGRQMTVVHISANLNFQAAEELARDLRIQYSVRGPQEHARYVVRRTGYQVGPVSANTRRHKVTVYKKAIPTWK